MADPENFFTSLETLGLPLKKKLSFSDHVEYQSYVVEQLRKAAVDIDALITTEKDAVKLLADMFELPCYQVSMNINIDHSTELIEDVTKRLWS